MKSFRLLRSVLFLMPLYAFTAVSGNPDLTGTILDADEKPIAGATVQIYTAKVKEGTSPYCPSCYLDCGKRAVTDTQGAFKIAALDSELLFNVLVVAEGFLPQFMDLVDPGDGPAIALLSPLPDERLKPENRVVGRVVGPGGKPVVGATIVPFAMELPRGTRYGRLDDVDPLSVSNGEGNFVITANEPDAILTVTVSARGLAPQRFRKLAAGPQPHELAMNTGSTITGRVLSDGAPVPQAVVGLVSEERSPESFIEETTVGVDKDGRFTLANVPAGSRYFLYVKNSSIGDIGASEIKHVATTGEGKITDAGTLNLVLGHVFAGRVVLSDGAAVPPKTRIMLSRDDAWDTYFCEPDEDGRFEIKHLAPGMYDMHLKVAGYTLSSKNPSLDLTNSPSLVGIVANDINDLEILLEPEVAGEHTGFNSRPEDWEKLRQLRKQPMRGAEAHRESSGPENP